MEAHASESTVDLRSTLIEIVIESWRMAKLFTRVLGKLEGTESNRYASQVRYFQKRLDEALAAVGLRVVNLEGQPYDPGMALTPLNIAEFGPEDVLIVDQMVEPILMGQDGVVKSGTALLKQSEQA